MDMIRIGEILHTVGHVPDCVSKVDGAKKCVWRVGTMGVVVLKGWSLHLKKKQF